MSVETPEPMSLTTTSSTNGSGGSGGVEAELGSRSLLSTVDARMKTIENEEMGNQDTEEAEVDVDGVEEPMIDPTKFLATPKELKPSPTSFDTPTRKSERSSESVKNGPTPSSTRQGRNKRSFLSVPLNNNNNEKSPHVAPKRTRSHHKNSLSNNSNNSIKTSPASADSKEGTSGTPNNNQVSLLFPTICLLS